MICERFIPAVKYVNTSILLVADSGCSGSSEKLKALEAAAHKIIGFRPRKRNRAFTHLQRLEGQEDTRHAAIRLGTEIAYAERNIEIQKEDYDPLAHTRIRYEIHD